MHLDAVTLLVVLCFVANLLSALLLLSWLQNRAVTALAWWSLSFLLGTVGIGLLASRGHLPDLLSIDAANAVTLLGYGLAWHGARVFDGRRGNLWIAAAGAALWLIACRIPAFYDFLLGKGRRRFGRHRLLCLSHRQRTLAGQRPAGDPARHCGVHRCARAFSDGPHSRRDPISPFG